MPNDDNFWMREALKEAEKGGKQNEVPVGAVVVFEQQIVGRAYNAPISTCNPIAHAETLALQEAAKTLGNYRLIDCDLYVTLEPCTMCAGAIIHSRIRRIIFGAHEPKAGAITSQNRILEQPYINYQVDVTPGILADECSALLSGFFRNRRAAIKAEKKHLRLC